MGLLDDKDGWYECNEESQHYFFKGITLCKKYLEITPEFHHDNDESKHCQLCQQKLRKLAALAASFEGTDISTIDAEKILDALEKIDLSKGTMVKESVPENTLAVLNAEDPKRRKLIKPDKKHK